MKVLKVKKDISEEETTCPVYLMQNQKITMKSNLKIQEKIM